MAPNRWKLYVNGACEKRPLTMTDRERAEQALKEAGFIPKVD